MQLEPLMIAMRILVDMVDPLRVKQRCAPLDAMHLVAFFKQKFG